MKRFNRCFVLLIALLFLLVSRQLTVPPEWLKHDSYGRPLPHKPMNYSTEENPNAKYNPNLPEELRSKYLGQKSTPEIRADVCTQSPDSGYYCKGTVGDLPPFYQRFYFDVRTQKCRCMLYNGCDGNQNNFRSYQQCQQWCSPNTSLNAKVVYNQGYWPVVMNKAQCLYFY